MVTASNGFLQLFSLDKNYFAYSMVVEQLKTDDFGNFLDYLKNTKDYKSHQDLQSIFKIN